MDARSYDISFLQVAMNYFVYYINDYHYKVLSNFPKIYQNYLYAVRRLYKCSQSFFKNSEDFRGRAEDF